MNKTINKWKIPSLDGVRGFAFLIVFASHISGLAFGKGVWGFGKIGVWMFFILSSFLLTYYFLNDTYKIKKPLEWLNYFVRRFLRIFPMYIVVLFIYHFFKNQPSSIKEIINHLLLQQGILHFWTIPVEFKYYFFIPIVVFFLYLSKLKPLNLIITIAILIFTHQYFFPVSKSIENSISLLQYLPVFLIGSFTAALHISLREIKLGTRFKILLDVLALLLILISILFIPGIRQYVFGIPISGYLVSKYIDFGIGCSVFLLCVLHGKGIFRSIFETTIFRFFGSISYPGYLIHVLVLSEIMDHFHEFNLFTLIIIIIGVVTSATALHELIEKPVSKINLMKYNKNDILSKLSLNCIKK